MRDTIGIRVKGKDGVVYLQDFLKAGTELLALLSELDKSLSSDFKPTVDWKITKLSYASPATLETEPVTKDDQPDNRKRIIDTAISGISKLRVSKERPNGFNDNALENARTIAKLTENGVEEIEIISGDIFVSYSNQILENIDTILKPGKQIFGSLDGKLERMNSHGDFLFYIYEPILDRRIKCELMNPKDTILKTKVIKLYESSVIVSGLLFTNINGEVSSAKIADISEQETVPLIKNASEVTGIWDFTGGIDPVEHIRRMRE